MTAPGHRIIAAIARAATIAAAGARAQAPERTIAEIRVEAQGRADRGNYPMIGLDPADVHAALDGIKTRDLDLLLHSGDVPKDAWINPQGGHLGREAKGWTDPVIFRRVIMPWELRLLSRPKDVAQNN